MGLFHDMTDQAAYTVATPRRRSFGLKGVSSEARAANSSAPLSSAPLSMEAPLTRDSLSRSAYRQRQSIGPAPLVGKKVLCVSAKPNCDVEEMSIAMGANVMPVSTLGEAERMLRESPREWDMMFIMRDGLMPLDHLVTDLLTLRFSFSELPVIMFSTAFMADDMTKDRSPISDASMCLPMTQGRLKMCVEAAAENVRNKE